MQLNWSKIEQAISNASGEAFRINRQVPVAGGCINDAFLISDHARQYFIKFNTAAHANMFAAEYEGLRMLAQANCIEVPRPLCHGVADGQSFLVMAALQLHSRFKPAQLGEQLARLHACTAPRYGWQQDNHIGLTPQPNTWMDNWPSFWQTQRLAYQLNLAQQKQPDAKLLHLGTRLLEKCESFFCGYSPAASLLHGDLWRGNVAATANGEAVIFDPAIYYGDRETDIAMTELFGGFAPAFYAAYNSAWRLDSGYRIRKDLYNLYHVLNHDYLFGGAYRNQAIRMIQALLAQSG